jgi:hypothetical protein
MGAFLKGVTGSGVATNPYSMGILDTVTFAYYGVQRNTNANTWQGKAGFTGNLPNQVLDGSNESIIIARYNSTTAYTIANGSESAVYAVVNPSTLTTKDFALFATRVNTSVSNYTSQPTNSMFFSEFDTLAETKAFEASYKTLLTEIGAI